MITNLPIDSLLVPTAPEKGQPPKHRFSSASKVVELYHKLRRADDISAINRTAVQAMFDGAPPYDEAQLRSTGQGARCNLNFGEAPEQLEKAMAAYVDLLSVEKLATAKTKYGPDNQRGIWEEIICDEFSQMLRGWQAFEHSYLFNALHFIVHGVAVSFFENELDWRWKVSPFGDFLIPRRTLATQDNLEVACAVRSYQVHELYRFIENEEIATAAGWNVPLVRKAISEAVPIPQNGSRRDWEALQTDLKDNDLYYGATSSEVRLIHTWVAEFDGRVSHYMALVDDTEDEFIYKKENRFASMSQVFTFFTYGIGTNGHYHGIRGLGHKIFPLAQYSNRLLSQEMDMAMLSSSIMIQPETEDSMDNMQLINYGSFTVVPPGMKFLERAAPNLIQAVEPALERMGGMLQRRAGQYTNNLFDGGQERTRFEVAAQLEHLSKLSITSLNLFYAPWGRHLKEVFRRVIRRDYAPAEPGGQAVAKFRLRCKQRGVPLEAIYEIDVDSVRAVRAVGAGSASARQLALNQLMELSPQYDDAGRTQVIREVTASLVGWDNVDTYKPPMDGPRPTTDDRFANLENAMMEQGTPMPVYPNDIHPVHARTHIARLAEMTEAVNSGQAMIADVTPIMVTLHEHAEQHVEAMSGDPTTAQEAAAYRQQLQQIGEIIYNGVKHLQKLQREQQTERMGQEGQPQEPTPAELDQAKWSRNLESKILESRLKLQMTMEKAQQEMTIRAAKAAQERALADTKAAADLRRTSLSS